MCGLWDTRYARWGGDGVAKGGGTVGVTVAVGVGGVGPWVWWNKRVVMLCALPSKTACGQGCVKNERALRRR